MQSWWTTKLLAAIALGMLGVCGMKWAMRKAREIFVNLRVMPLCALAAILVGGVISTVEAQKRGGGNISRGNAERAEVVRNDEPYGGLGLAALTERGLSDATLPLRGGETGYSVTAEDIARGWRVESVTTNAAFGYQGEYTNRADNTFWHQRGGCDMNCLVDFNGFEFPLASNTLTKARAFTGGTIWSFDPPATRQVLCAATQYASFQPWTSSFWHADADNGAKLITWENVFGVGTNQFSAQIELRPNGDFMLRSNCVETVCRRINPDDWDDDGLPNDVDPNPMTWDGDFTGPDNILPNDANTNAYYTISIRVAGPDSLVSFVGDGPSNYPDPQFVARGGELYDVVLLMGKKYEISCSRPVSVVSASDPATQVWNDWNGERNIQMVRRPVTATATSLAGFGSPESKRQFRMSVEPNNLNGVFSWTNSCGAISVFGSDIFMYAPCLGCTCGGCCAYGNYSYEGYSLAATGGMCPCEFLDDNPQIESSISPQPAVSAAFSHSAVIYEDRYENLPNQWVEKRSTRTRLDIQANGGLRGGTLSVAVQNLDKLARFSGANPPTAAVAVAAGDMVTYSAIYEAATHSAEPNDISVVATFAENETGETLAATSKVTTVKVTTRVALAAPENSSLSRHVFGIGEWVHLDKTPTNATITISLNNDPSLVGSQNNQFWCPWAAGTYSLKVSSGATHFASPITVFEPEPRAVLATWDGNEGTNGCAGQVIMNMELLMYPLYVSFCGIWAEEIPDELETCPKSGYYADPTVGKPWSHTTAAGAGKWREISAYNEWTHDKAGTRASYPMPWRAGWKEWDIPVGWGQYRGELLGRCVPDPTTQRFDIEANGTVTVRKFGHWIKRNTSCDVWVDGNKVN